MAEQVAGMGGAERNPLATAPIDNLIVRFAVPAVISGLISALYNIVDQIFIGNSVGMLGNGATNVAFPIVTFCTALALLLGVGSASAFSLRCGTGDADGGVRVAANGLLGLAVSGTALGIVVACFLEPLLLFFGATADNLPYALTYTGTTSIGIPFLVFGTGGSHLIRADGSPRYSMISVASGAILNCVLDPIFIFGMDMGMAGAAWATVLGQFLSFGLVLAYLVRFRTRRFRREDFVPNGKMMKRLAGLGAAACFNQLAMAVVQIVLNNTLRVYGAQSMYGSDIPLACVGIVSKVNVVFIAVMVGIAQGCQPIFGFNYGAANYKRVKKTFMLALKIVMVVSVLAFILFQFFPSQIISLFGGGSEEYYRFATRFFRVYMMMVCVLGLQPLAANFFTSIGKARLGILMSLARQIVCLLPLIVLLPQFWGIDGVLIAGPIADGIAAIVATIFVVREMRNIDALDAKEHGGPLPRPTSA